MRPSLINRLLKYLLIMSAVLAVSYALIWIMLQGYSAAWTGFADFTKPNSDFERGKTLWDWLQLLIIPIFLSVGLFFLNRSERENERRRTEERAQLEHDLIADRQREAALQSYLDRMADLLLKEKLRTSGNEEVRNVARTRTLTVFRGLDAWRKRIVLLFLKDSGLIEPNIIIDLGGADLSGIDLSHADLSQLNLSGANLNQANLQNAYLREANLRETKLREADLREANLFCTEISLSDLSGANLTAAYLHGADLTRSDLSGATLCKSNLREAKLNQAILLRTNLVGADLTKADLTAAEVNREQLASATSLAGATMPDGTIHD